jgi:hypothetical protein
MRTGRWQWILYCALISSVLAVPDRDRDGIPDDIDTVIGDETLVDTDCPNLSIRIGPYESTDPAVSALNESYEVVFNSSHGLITRFELDFATAQLDLTKVRIIHRNNQSAIVTKGLDIDVPKTLYVNRQLADARICVKDADIDSVEDISSNCMDEHELFFSDCEEGETIGGITCTIENGQYVLTGLSHSGATELNISGIFYGYFTVEYMNSLDTHRPGYLMPGESIRICFESARPVADDERMRILFSPQWGGLTINEFWMPHTIGSMNVHVYP